MKIKWKLNGKYGNAYAKRNKDILRLQISSHIKIIKFDRKF